MLIAITNQEAQLLTELLDYAKENDIINNAAEDKIAASIRFKLIQREK